ncbi:hypothetical protein ColLi_06660 [Colletotrichum liriopes]|uniref:Uncharacterized protein n=1 Tax=Colletotrichum liriopes TaxID=708192 RepID=A0AA37GNS5_9PEZI|nr:hypothetical protein ColLi_06660 [Colletotrichum liriopes]
MALPCPVAGRSPVPSWSPNTHPNPTTSPPPTRGRKEDGEQGKKRGNPSFVTPSTSPFNHIRFCPIPLGLGPLPPSEDKDRDPPA